MIYAQGREFVSQVSYDAFRRKQAEAAQKEAQADADAQAKAQAIAEGRHTIRSRNATTHGLFARDVVLPHLGEDPQGYAALLAEFTAQLKPKDLLERHYTEKITAASWRLRRLHRWQAQLFEDDALTEDERLDKLDKVLRHETALHRQIDTAVKMLSREVPKLFEGRSRETALSLVQVTERDCAKSEDTDWDVARTAREQRTFAPLPDTFDYAALDNTRLVDTQNCQNEPAPRSLTLNPLPSEERACEGEGGEPRRAGRGGGGEARACEGEGGEPRRAGRGGGGEARACEGEGDMGTVERSRDMACHAPTPSASVPMDETAETNPPLPASLPLSEGGGGGACAGEGVQAGGSYPHIG